MISAFQKKWSLFLIILFVIVAHPQKTEAPKTTKENVQQDMLLTENKMESGNQDPSQGQTEGQTQSQTQGQTQGQTQDETQGQGQKILDNTSQGKQTQGHQTQGQQTRGQSTQGQQTNIRQQTQDKQTQSQQQTPGQQTQGQQTEGQHTQGSQNQPKTSEARHKHQHDHDHDEQQQHKQNYDHDQEHEHEDNHEHNQDHEHDINHQEQNDEHHDDHHNHHEDNHDHHHHHDDHKNEHHNHDHQKDHDHHHHHDDHKNEHHNHDHHPQEEKTQENIMKTEIPNNEENLNKNDQKQDPKNARKYNNPHHKPGQKYEKHESQNKKGQPYKEETDHDHIHEQRGNKIPPIYQGHRYGHGHRHANPQNQGHSHSHGHSHNHGSVFQKHLETNNFLKTFKRKFDEFIPNLYMKAIVGILMLSLPSLPVFMFLSLVSRFISKKKEEKFSEETIQMMIAFSAGTLLGDLLLHMFPHLMEEKDSKHILYDWFGSEAIFIYIIMGVVVFLIIDFSISVFLNDKPNGHDHTHTHEKIEDDQSSEDGKIVKNSNKDSGQSEIKKREGAQKKKKGGKHKKIEKEQEGKNERTGSSIQTFIYLLGDMTHNFIDGMAVGASFVISTELGLVTSLAILVHEIPHEIGDFAYLYKHNYSLFQILKTQIITSLGAFIGGILGINWGTIYKVELLAFTTGAFLYLCLVNLFPELKNDLMKSKSIIRLILNVILIWLGVALMYFMTSLE